MSTITLPNVRATSDITALVKLKDGGLAIDWSGLTGIKAWLYSDEQRAISGRFDVSVSQEDPTALVCDYSAQKPQYLGINRIIVQAKYNGRTKTYDQPLCNLVRWTEDQAGEQITLDDPVVDVEIEVEDVTSSILDGAIAAALDAAEKANSAASHPPVIIDGVWWIWDASAGEYVATESTAIGQDGRDGRSPYVGSNGHWFAFNDSTLKYEDTGVSAQGPKGDPGEDGKDGGLLFPTFEIDAAMHLRMSDDDAAATGRFALKDGHLTVTV